MPVMSGAEAASILKKKFPKISIIVFTLDDAAIAETLKSLTCVAAVLSKLGGVEALMEGIDTVLAIER